MTRALILVLALVWQWGAQAQTPPSGVASDAVAAGEADDVPARIEAERTRLQSERAAIEQAHDNGRRECWQRFAVNDCLRNVRRSQRTALEPLRVRELELNAQERAWRTQQREERLKDKRATQERRP